MRTENTEDGCRNDCEGVYLILYHSNLQYLVGHSQNVKRTIRYTTKDSDLKFTAFLLFRDDYRKNRNQIKKVWNELLIKEMPKIRALIHDKKVFPIPPKGEELVYFVLSHIIDNTLPAYSPLLSRDLDLGVMPPFFKKIIV